jgi:hypothetical protein
MDRITLREAIIADKKKMMEEKEKENKKTD